MKSHGKTFIHRLICLLVSLILLGGTSGCTDRKPNDPDTLNGVLAHYGVVFTHGDGYRILKHEPQKIEDGTLINIVAEKQDYHLEITIKEPMDEVKSRDFTLMKQTLIRNLYTPTFAPYPGVITISTEIPEEAKPRERKIRIFSGEADLLIVGATDRFILGAVTREQVAKKAAVVMVQDILSKRHFQLHLFQPTRSFDEQKAIVFLSGFQKLHH